VTGVNGEVGKIKNISKDFFGEKIDRYFGMFHFCSEN